MRGARSPGARLPDRGRGTVQLDAPAALATVLHAWLADSCLLVVTDELLAHGRQRAVWRVASPARFNASTAPREHRAGTPSSIARWTFKGLAGVGDPDGNPRASAETRSASAVRSRAERSRSAAAILRRHPWCRCRTGILGVLQRAVSASASRWRLPESGVA